MTNFDNDENVFYVDTYVDSINLTDYKGKEVVIQFLTDIKNK